MNPIRELRLPSIPALALYLATVLTEAPVIAVRMLLTLATLALLLLVKGQSPKEAEGLMELAVIPTAWSAFALLTPLGGGWWWAQNLGGRDPSERERAAYHHAIELLLHGTHLPVRLPGSWFVLDSPQPDAAVCGNTLMLSRGLLENEYLPAVIAHELGHLNTSDGKLTAAINRLIINPLPLLRQKRSRERSTMIVGSDRLLLSITVFGSVVWIVRKAFGFAKGGFALRLLAPFWGSYWREREYLADQFAARLGQADELADFLDIHALMHDQPVPLVWLSEHTHPPTELRIDRLRKAGAPVTASLAPGSEPLKAAPAGPPAAGPVGPALTEPDPFASEHSRRQGGACRPSFDEIR